MPERNPKVQDRIREELKQNPGATTGELQAIAEGVDSSVGGLSLRQFNAGYVLPLKRRAGGASGKAAKRGKAATAGARRKGGRKPAPAPTPTPPRAPARQRVKSPAAPEGERERVRATLMEFARDFSAAESKSAVVAVLSDIDRYVDRIVGSRR